MPGLMLGASSRNRDIFDPAHERDACGVGFVADVEGRASHSILETAVYSLCRVRHRGAVDADGKSGDGAGILTSLPVDFFAAEAARMGTPADPSFIGVAMTFVWNDGHRGVIEEACRWEGIEVIGWRVVPVDDETLGDRAKATRPVIEQALFLKPIGLDAAEAERRFFFQAEDGIRALYVTGVQTCALPISPRASSPRPRPPRPRSSRPSRRPSA